jgi:hypothetical protein
LNFEYLGDYRIGERLVNESASAIVFAPPAPQPEVSQSKPKEEKPSENKNSLSAKLPDLQKKLPSKLSNVLPHPRSRPSSPEPKNTSAPASDEVPAPRRLAIVVVGLKPHRKIWTSSARPGESVIQYQLLNGCPAVVVPVKPGAPLLAWDALSLEELWKLLLPEGEKGPTEAKDGIEGSVNILLEFLDLCVDWDTMAKPVFTAKPAEVKELEKVKKENEKRSELRNAVELLVAGAVKSGESKEVRDKVDQQHAGIAMWRIP